MNFRGAYGSFRWGVILLLTASIFFACTSGEETYAVLEPEGAPREPSLALVRVIMDRHCTPCHKSDASSEDENEEDEDEDEDDGDELEDLDFESCQGLWENRGELLRVVIDKTMPPGAWPRLDDRDVQIIFNWVTTTFECPCQEECP